MDFTKRFQNVAVVKAVIEDLQKQLGDKSWRYWETEHIDLAGGLALRLAAAVVKTKEEWNG